MLARLEEVAFATGDRFAGTLALMQAALKAIGQDGHNRAGIYLDMAIHALMEDSKGAKGTGTKQ